MTTRVACNYAAVRFRPYPETEEFANIGVVLSCATEGLFLFRVDTSHRKRVTDFWPELDPAVFSEGRARLVQELERLGRELTPAGREGDLPLVVAPEVHRALFQELTRPRETLFRLSGVGTALSHDPQATLDALYADLVERQFALTHEYQEARMRQALQEVLHSHDLLRFYRESRLGNDDFHVRMPFVYLVNQRAVRAIRPLNLGQDEPTEIRDHGDAWLSRVHRLQTMRAMPDRMLFVVREPDSADTRRRRACDEILGELTRGGVEVVSFAEQSRVIAFAVEGAAAAS
jgi:hypothetical protein